MIISCGTFYLDLIGTIYFDTFSVDKKDVMRIIYIKFMRLKTTYYPVYSIMRNIYFDYELPDIRTGLINTYTIDFITTINGFFTSGKYSFEFLNKEANLVDEYKAIKSRISKYYGINKIRNLQICHFTDKMNPNDIYSIFGQSQFILDEIISFYDKVCKKLNIDISSFGYADRKWKSFDEEVKLFDEIIHSCDQKLMKINLERNLEKIRNKNK